MKLARRATAEGVGTAMLLVAVVGSGIMAERLAAGNVALALLANAIATGGALAAVIVAISPISGAHLNPVVTLAAAWNRTISWSHVPSYVAAQTAGAIGGVVIANAMFGLPAISLSHHARTGSPLLLGEFVATFGLLIVIRGCERKSASTTAFTVASYIIGAYWCTSSTSFANPAVTLARSLSDTFAGIHPGDVAPFVAMQLLGAACATVLYAYLSPVDRDAIPSPSPEFVYARNVISSVTHP